MISKRHIAKTITWRIIGTLDTITLAYLISGELENGLRIGGFEIITKMILYYLHEQFWFKSKLISASQRHLIKTFSWRFLGTIDTFVLSWVITGSSMVGIQIGATETVTKMVLYYLHEKAWYKINFGINSLKRKYKYLKK